MSKRIHLLFLSLYMVIVCFLSLCRINSAIIFTLSLLPLFYLYLFHKKRLRGLSSQLNTLLEVAQVRGMFVNIASHEFRNPMTTIYSSVDLLENYFENLDHEEKLRLFESIRKSIRRMTKMMDDIVLIGKLQHNQISCNPQDVDILSLCSTIYEGLGPERQRIQMTVDSQLSPIVSIDQSLTDLILSNLLSNALKYSEQSIHFSVKLRDNALIFDIKDQGIGIPKDEIQKLSQLFGRCSNTGSRKGIGIGMFLVSHCVKLHNGTIKVSSQENQGTHFRVTIPLSHD